MQDDAIGAEFPLCETDFNSEDSEDNMVRWFADTQFDAVLFCGDCKLPSPPPPPLETMVDPNAGLTSFAAVSSHVLLMWYPHVEPCHAVHYFCIRRVQEIADIVQRTPESWMLYHGTSGTCAKSHMSWQAKCLVHAH